MLRRLSSLFLIAAIAFASGANASSAPKKEEAATGANEYMDIKPALVTNYGGPGPIHFIKAEIALRTGKNPDDNVKVAHHMPQIRHALLMLLMRQTEDAVTTMEGKEQLRKDALAAVQKIITDEEGVAIVTDLLFNNFIIQR